MTKVLLTRQSTNGACDVTRFNALRHGVLSRYTVLPWEDENEYRELLDALVAEHKPRGPTEEHLVEELVGVLWRKRRLRLAEGAACRRAIKSEPSKDTIGAALVHLDVFREESGDAAKQLADLAQHRTLVKSAIELLHSGRARSYDKALSSLSGEMQERWDQATRSKPRIELFDFSSPSFPENAEGLAQFLEDEVLPRCEARRLKINHSSEIRSLGRLSIRID